MASYLLHSGLGELCLSSRKDSSDSLLLSVFYSFIQLLKPKSFTQLFQGLSLTAGFSLKDVQHLSISCHLPPGPHHHTPSPASPGIYPGCPDLSSFAAARDTLFTHRSDNVSLLRELPSPHKVSPLTQSIRPSHPRIGLSHQTTLLIPPLPTSHCPCSLCFSPHRPLLSNDLCMDWPLPGMLFHYVATWLQFSFPEGPCSNVTFSKTTCPVLFI